MSTFTFDTQSWSDEQFGNCDLGDKRRTKRLVRLATQVVSNPAASLPEQTETWSDLKGAYRLFDSPEVTFEAVTKLHYEHVRARDAGRYLVLGDTTELDFGNHRDIPDLAPTGNGGGWVAMDTIPSVRCAVIRRLLETCDSGPMHVKDVAEATKLPVESTRRTLEDLHLIGVVDRQENGAEGTKAVAWRLKGEIVRALLK